MAIKQEQKSALRLQFLYRVVARETQHLTSTDQRLFSPVPFDIDRAQDLDKDLDLSERVDAFVGRFSRLQDTLGDKLLPALLNALGERVGAMIDNLDLAERLGLISSADDWLMMRNLRNQMVHEYVEDLRILTDAIQSAHTFVPALTLAANRMMAEIEARGFVESSSNGYCG